MSYLIDLTLLLRCRLNSNNESQRNEAQKQQCLARLLEMKTALEKIRPLEKRMRYQIDKLLALATLGAGTFAATGREEEEEEKEEGKEEETVTEGQGQPKKSGEDANPLSFKPDLQGMMKMFQEDDEEDKQNENDSDDESNGSDDSDEDPSSKPKIALEKDDNDNNNGVYQPPRLQSVPFELQNNESLAIKQRDLLEKQRAKQSRSELTQLLKSQYTDLPEEEDVRGGASLGTQSEKSRKLAAQDADIQEFEETQMIRLTMGKKEKKARKKVMRDELSNLGVIAGGLGSVVAGVDEAFGSGGGGRGGGDDGDGMGGGRYKMKGMRKRRVEVLDGSGGGGGNNKLRSKKKKKGAVNSYQKSLYGGRGGGGGKSKKKK